MTVYADVLVIVNLYVDFLLLWCTKRALHIRAKPWRLAAGALLGALCSLECLIPHQSWWVSLLWGAIAAALTTSAAFLPLSRRGFLQAALCFWALSLGLAGFLLFLIQLLAPRSLAVVGHAVYFDLSLPLLFLCTAGAYLVFWIFQRLFHRENLTPRVCQVEIRLDGKSVVLWAKADTGCALREPFSGLPVMVCQAAALGPLLPPGNVLEEKESLPPGYRLIPFESVGGNGLLPGFRPESVHRLPKGTPVRCYVALWDRQFPSQDFQALYGPDQFPELSE